MAVEQQASGVGVGPAAEPDRCSDEALHQVAFRRAHIGFVDIDAVFSQAFFKLQQMTVLSAIQAQYRATMEIGEGEGAQFAMAFAAQYGFRSFALFGRNECDRLLVRQAHMTRAVISRKPEFDFGTGSRISPVTGKEKTLFQLNQRATWGLALFYRKKT